MQKINLNGKREKKRKEKKEKKRQTLLSAVDELSSVHTLSTDEDLVLLAVLVGVTELNLGKGGTTAGVVDDLFHDALNVTMPLGVVQWAVLSSSLTVLGVRAEDRSGSLSLCWTRGDENGKKKKKGKGEESGKRKWRERWESQEDKDRKSTEKGFPLQRPTNR